VAVAFFVLSPASAVVAEVPASPSRAVAAGRFAEGERAYAVGDFRAAAVAFESAHLADPQPASAWNAARSWHLAGELAQAATFYRRYLDLAPPGAADRDEATRQLLALAGEIARVEVVGVEPSVLRVDGRSAIAAVLYLVPGTHRIEAEFPEGSVGVTVELLRGEQRSMVLERPKPAMLSKPSAELNGGRPSQVQPVEGASPSSPGGVSPWLAQWEDGKFKQDRTNVAIGISVGLGVASLAVALFAVDFGAGTLVGFDSRGLRVHF
jgi:hypothetical protein